MTAFVASISSLPSIAFNSSLDQSYFHNPQSSLKSFFSALSHTSTSSQSFAMTTFTVESSSLTNLRNKTTLITGGSSGIGLATVILLTSLDSSNRVAIVDRDPPPSSLNISSDRLFYQKCDITNWKDQRSAFEAAIAKFGCIDAVFVNAGIAEYKDQFFTDVEDSSGKLAEPDRRTLNIDMDAAADTVKLAIHWLKRNGKDGGSIIMTASLAGYLASAGAPLYSAAKHGR
jgi:NAD(P)-dependent dehydrogenase (short-subunit alcohol dehydrogenase family)